LRCLMHAFDPKNTVCCYMFHSRIGADDLIRYLLGDLGLEPHSTSKSDLLLQLSAHLVSLFRKGVTPVLIIDEAQNLDAAALEEVRLLTNLETAEAKLLQVILAGQPELDQKLGSHELRQLRQRIMLRFRLSPLTREQSRCYIESRLQLAGHSGERLFTAAALDGIQVYSQGVPRLINVLCGNALLCAYAQGQTSVGAECVEEVAAELELSGEAGAALPAAMAAECRESSVTRSISSEAKS